MNKDIIEIMANGMWDGLETVDLAGRRLDAIACISALKKSGYAIVPVKPTDSMMSAGHKQYQSLYNRKRTKYTSGPVIYQAMIEAAEDE